MDYLLLIHVGPVQDFIASARRSRDLWFGSRLLSELSKAAAQAVVEKEGDIARLIFPAPNDVDDLKRDSELIVANKIVARIKSPPTTEADDEVRQAIWSRLRSIRREACKYVNGDYEKKIAKDQVDDLPEYFWVAVPFDEATYEARRDQAEALLAARKSTRDFQPVGWGANKPKSSLDGIRESVIPEEAYPPRPDPADPENEALRKRKIEALFKEYGARPAERLSGVDLMKRHGRRGLEESGFPSTSHVAALPLRQRLEETQGLKAAWEAYRQTIPAEVLKQERLPKSFEAHPIFGHDDGSLLFESRLNEHLEEPELSRAKEKLRNFLDKAAGPDQASFIPLPYYALLLADGDGMGQVIKAQKNREAHRQFSRTLNEFAGEVRGDDKKPGIVARYQGALVYAGGDDVLAFVPLHQVLRCAKALADTFRDKMKAANLTDDRGNTPTFSAGIAISHHLDPLSDALKLARRAERKAKDVPSKDALAVSVDMRSGVDRTVVGHWGEVDIRLDMFTNFHRHEAIPDGAAYQLRDVSLRLGGEDVIKDDELLQEIVQKEAERILGRKRAQRGASDLSKAVLKELKGFVAKVDLSVEQLATELIIARLLARAKDQAGEPRDPLSTKAEGDAS